MGKIALNFHPLLSLEQLFSVLVLEYAQLCLLRLIHFSFSKGKWLFCVILQASKEADWIARTSRTIPEREAKEVPWAKSLTHGVHHKHASIALK